MEIEVIVQSILPSDEPQGRYRIKINSEATVGILLRKICAEVNVPMKHSYCLYHADNKLLPQDSTLMICNVTNGELVHWTNEDITIKKGVRFSTWWFMCIISLLIGAIGLITIISLQVTEGTAVFDYGLVMDAGSSHTSLYIYKWDGAKYKQTAIASQFGDTCKVAGKDISSFAANPQDVAIGLQHCLDMAKTIIPEDHWKISPVYLGATAGMRLLNAVNSSQSNAILQQVRKTIKQYPFLFDDPDTQARIITGSEEGMFSWITTNYISKSFNVGPQTSSDALKAKKSKTIGALDMGGASAQISFIPNNFTVQPANFSKSIRLYGVNYTLYTHSFLCYGVNEAQRRIQAALTKAQNYSLIVTDPCAPKDVIINSTFNKIFKAPCSSGNEAIDAFGFILDGPANIIDTNETVQFIGESDPEGCKLFVEDNLFNFTQPCKYPHCSFNGQYQPDVSGNFYAFSSFYYVSYFLNLTDGTKKFTLEEFQKATSEFCSKTWEEVKVIPTTVPQKASLPWYCFQANYIISMLTKGYKFNVENWNTLQFVANIDDTDIGWALGFMLNESNQIPSEKSELPITTTTFVLLLILFCLFLFVSLCFACHAKKSTETRRGGYSLFSNYGSV